MTAVVKNLRSKRFWSAVTRSWTTRVIGAVLILFFSAVIVKPAMAQEPPGDTPAQVFLPLVRNVPQLRDPSPTDGLSSVSPNTFLQWALVADGFPNPTFTVYLENDDPTPDVAVATDLTLTHLDPPELKVGSRYYWQVVVESSNGIAVPGRVWTFHTIATDDLPQIGSMVPIPAGEYQMGCDPLNTGGYDCRDFRGEEPLHRVWIDAFEMDRYEVTNQEYRSCVSAGACANPRRFNSLSREDYFQNPQFDDYPVLFVSWWDANAYCGWAGKRLPTEAEWEKAARGPWDTRPWPWGWEMIDCSRANFTDDREDSWRFCIFDEEKEKYISDTDRVGSYPLGASPYGVLDMSGNVFEWVKDGFDIHYYSYSPYRNPQGPAFEDQNNGYNSAGGFSIRGGSYRPRWYYPRSFNRHWGHHGDSPFDDEPYYRNDQVGFRCARSLP
jgi:formylglycine-generating enzyme required for sulfatase activity